MSANINELAGVVVHDPASLHHLIDMAVMVVSEISSASSNTPVKSGQPYYYYL